MRICYLFCVSAFWSLSVAAVDVAPRDPALLDAAVCSAAIAEIRRWAGQETPSDRRVSVTFIPSWIMPAPARSWLTDGLDAYQGAFGVHPASPALQACVRRGLASDDTFIQYDRAQPAPRSVSIGAGVVSGDLAMARISEAYLPIAGHRGGSSRGVLQFHWDGGNWVSDGPKFTRFTSLCAVTGCP